MDVVQQIQAFNAGRDPERLRMKYQRMRSDAFAFLRGSCHLFYSQLPLQGPLKAAPLAWVCGDLHLENFGSYKADNGLVYFDVNDFDESALAPCTWDVVRLLASLRLAAPTWGLARKEAAALSQRMLATYADALAQGKAYWVERDTAQGVVRELLEGRRARSRAQYLDSRTTRNKAGRRRLAVDGRYALPASAADAQGVKRFMAELAATEADPAFYKLLDVARRVAGTGSLGVPRWVVLVRGKGSPDGNYLLDLKLAQPSALLPRLKAAGVAQPRWPSQAERVVALQRRLQAVSMALLQPTRMAGTPYVLRALQPSEDRIALARVKPRALADALDTLARATAWLHLRGAGRQGAAGADALVDFGRRQGWRKPLLALADDCAAQALADAGLFNTAYDGRAFALAQP